MGLFNSKKSNNNSNNIRKKSIANNIYNTAKSGATLWCTIRKYIALFVMIVCIIPFVFGFRYLFKSDKYDPKNGGGSANATIISDVTETVNTVTEGQAQNKYYSLSFVVTYNGADDVKIMKDMYITGIPEENRGLYKKDAVIEILYDKDNNIIAKTNRWPPRYTGYIILGITSFVFLCSFISYLLVQTSIGCALTVVGNTGTALSSFWGSN